MVGVKFHWEKETTFLERETPKRMLFVFFFLSYHLIFFQRSLKAVWGHGSVTSINNHELSHISRSFDVNWVKYSLCIALALQLAVDILNLKRYCFGFSS